MTTTALDDYMAKFYNERNKVLMLVDQLVRNELGDAWTLDAHIALKSAMLNKIDSGSAVK